MKAILDAIDAAIMAALPAEGIKAYGLCIPVLKDNQTHPVTVDNKQVAINDRWNVNYFHRLLNDPIRTDDEEFTFGGTIRKRHLQTVRTVVAIKKIKGFDFIDTFINAIPETLSMANYKIVQIYNGISKNVDQDTIYKTEFGDGDYEKHRTAYIIYALEYGIDYITCASTVQCE